MKARAQIRLIGLALIVVGLMLSWQWIAEFWEVDRCLDAGGSYNYVERRCEAVTSYARPLSRGIDFIDGLGIVLASVGLGTILRSFKRNAL